MFSIQKYSLPVVILFLFVIRLQAQEIPQVGQWDRFELTLNGSATDEAFLSIPVTAEFTNGEKTIKVNGFYDGKGVYKVRFMPDQTGQWQYKTSSKQKALHNKSGKFTCIPASSGNHGPVQVADTFHFKYADGKPYYPFGTTLYAWTHQTEELENTTLETLKNAPFNKVRMCVFPKHYAHAHVSNEPERYPFVLKDKKTDKDGKISFTWDFKKFNPEFFQHLEKRIDQLSELGIEADLIIFHPYDKGRWGFDNLGKENDLRYIEYLVARLSSFRNIWWSLANEFDYIKTKPREVWADYTKAVVEADPYDRLCSIHNGSYYYENWKPEYSHVSIQNGSVTEDFGRAILLRDVFFRPVVYDEVCYEGDLPQRWGNLTGEEMVKAFWHGTIAGTYVTHGETYYNPEKVIFWAKGGKLVGSSPSRIQFLRKFLEEGPGPLELADPWKDHRVARAKNTRPANKKQTQATPATGIQGQAAEGVTSGGGSYYVVYFAEQMQTEWAFDLPKKNGPLPGQKFKIDIVDTWNMTITPVPGVFEADAAEGYRVLDTKRQKIRLPYQPWLALRIQETE